MHDPDRYDVDIARAEWLHSEAEQRVMRALRQRATNDNDDLSRLFDDLQAAIALHRDLSANRSAIKRHPDRRPDGLIGRDGT